jgi:hypothetical protein
VASSTTPLSTATTMSAGRSGRRGSLQIDASMASHAGRPRHAVVMRAMHEQVLRVPPLTRATTTSATTVAGLAILPGSANSQGAARPMSGQGAARPTSRRSWRMMRSCLCSRNTTTTSGSASRINVFVILWGVGVPKCTYALSLCKAARLRGRMLV